MKILITGTAGRIGSAIYHRLAKQYSVIGLDKQQAPTVDIVGDICDGELITSLVSDVDAVVHTAALHAPHVGIYSDELFQQVNVEATEQLALACVKAKVKHLVFTSTTALFGHASTPEGKAGWVDESLVPQPKTIYHSTKITAEKCLRDIAGLFGLGVTVLRMSRCFPEPAPLMAAYRLHRGIDARDVAGAHAKAIERRLSGFNQMIVSGVTPFQPQDCEALFYNAKPVIQQRCPELADEFIRRGWELPDSIDRVYDSRLAQKLLDWQPQYGYREVLHQFDGHSAEVLRAF